jgi:hypothetical protein
MFYWWYLYLFTYIWYSCRLTRWVLLVEHELITTRLLYCQFFYLLLLVTFLLSLSCSYYEISNNVTRLRCEFYSRPLWDVLDMSLCDKVYQWQVSGFLQFPKQIIPTSMILWKKCWKWNWSLVISSSIIHCYCISWSICFIVSNV